MGACRGASLSLALLCAATAAQAGPSRSHAAPAGLTASAETSATSVQDPWWEIFADPVLDGLIRQADAGATSIDAAEARLLQAQAQLAAASGARLPRLGVAADASRRTGPLINAAGGSGSLFGVRADAGYEIDLTGRLKKARKAAALDVRAQEALVRYARLEAQAATAELYFRIRALDEDLALLDAALASRRAEAGVLQGLAAAGVRPQADALRASGELAAVESERLEGQRRRAQLEHALAELLGRPAAEFALPAAVLPGEAPRVPGDLPSQAIVRRPDVAAAAAALDASRQRLGAARSAWFPSFSLTASGGYASSDLGDLLRTSARSLGLGALVVAPILDGGARRAAVKGAEGQAALADAEHRARVLAAFREVEDSLTSLKTLGEQSEVLRAATEADAEALRELEGRYQAGLAPRLEIFDAQRTELKARRDALRVRADRFVATVDLVRALGGGWSLAPGASQVGFN